MSLTNFPNGITSFGTPILGGGGTLPLMGANAKVFFVDPANGSDSNDGLTPLTALDTVTAAYNKTTSGAGDVVYLISDGGTTGTARDVAITWANNNTHLVGICAPTIVNQRARIAPPSTDTDVDAYTPYITVSGSGCIFMNFSVFQGNSEDSKSSIGIKVSGSRNYFYNVAVLNGAHANQADEETYNVQLTGSENTFDSCYIGVDTVSRGNNAVSANVRFGSDATDQSCRNVFRNCIFPCFADDTEPTFIYAKTAGDCDRWQIFDRCIFVNSATALGGSTLDAGVKWAATSGGVCLLYDCAFYGVTDVTAADNTYVQVYAPTPGTPVDAGQFKSVDIS
jgi:hypothetical protein